MLSRSCLLRSAPSGHMYSSTGVPKSAPEPIPFSPDISTAPPRGSRAPAGHLASGFAGWNPNPPSGYQGRGEVKPGLMPGYKIARLTEIPAQGVTDFGVLRGGVGPPVVRIALHVVHSITAKPFIVGFFPSLNAR